MTDAYTKSSNYLRSDLEISSLPVTPVLYLSNGLKLSLPAVTLPPSDTAVININDALASQGRAPYVTLSGYVDSTTVACSKPISRATDLACARLSTTKMRRTGVSAPMPAVDLLALQSTRYSVRMQNLVQRSRFYFLAIIIILVLSSLLGATADILRYNSVSREVIQARLEKYKGSDQQRETTLKQMFTEAGCDDQHLSEQAVKGSKLPNVICLLPGSSDRAIIVGAHFDHVPEGDGVVDNWSGAALLPSLYQGMKREPRKHTYIFIGFTDEEKGEVGSHFYAQQMTKAQVAATDAMVNMDTLGLAPTEVWASHSDKQLTGVLVYIAKQLNTTVTGMNVDEIGSTDSVQFSERKIPSITIHSLNQETWNAHILHTSKDKFSAMHLDDYYQTYKLLLPYLVFLDQALGNPPQSNTH